MNFSVKSDPGSLPPEMLKQAQSFLSAVPVDREQEFQRLFRGMVLWLRQGTGAGEIGQRLEALTRCLADEQALCRAIGLSLHEWLAHAHTYPAFVGLGLFSRRGFVRELTERIYERFAPSACQFDNLQHLLWFCFDGDDDDEWLIAMGAEPWLGLFSLLWQQGDEAQRKVSGYRLREEALYALEMLAIWVAAEELEPELLRLEPSLINIDSAFVALQREVADLVVAEKRRLSDDSAPAFDDAHLRVLLDQCQKQVGRFRRRTVERGTSVALTHLLERLDQTLSRIETLINILSPQVPESVADKSARLFVSLAAAASEQHRVRPLWQSNTRLLARSISENKSDHGEHYITRDRKGYFAMFGSAAGAGVVIAVLALIKIHIESWGLAPLASAVLVSLNYGLGFVLVHLLHFTIATKQPAMTAAALAADIENRDKGRANQRKLAGTLVDVLRSQFAAVMGNVLAAVLVAFAIASVVMWWSGAPLLDAEAVSYQYDAVNPVFSLALLYAAVAGVWLFCSGVISGYFDNRADYVGLRDRLRIHPLLTRFVRSQQRRERLSDYLHKNYGAILGNFLFGCLLGMSGYFGYLSGLPLDIRHVAFSSANIAYAGLSDSVGVGHFLVLLVFVLMIGVVNLAVSFSLALNVALRARATRIGDFGGLLRAFWARVRAEPSSLLWPPGKARENTTHNK